MVEALVQGVDPPWEATRAAVCERMGWTFEDFDSTATRDILELLEVWKIQEKMKKSG